MYAVIEAGGKQYRVQKGDVITVEKLAVEAGEKITFDKVLIVGAGADTQIGTPYLDVSVYGTVVENGKGKKVIIYKYKSKKDYRKKQGHRQPYTMVEITGIGTDKTANGSENKVEDKPAKAPAEEVIVSVDRVSMSMKKAEIIAYAKENNIEVDEKATKQVLIDTINAAK